MRNATRHLLNGSAAAPETSLQPPETASTSRSATPQPNGAALTGARSSSRAPSVPPTTDQHQPTFDVAVEASKLPLHIALVECLAAAATEDRIKKILNGGLVIIGGVANTPHVGFAIQSRLSYQLSTRYPNLANQVNVVQLPPELGAGDIVWKGASLLGKVDAINELFVRAEEWDLYGLKALKERTPTLALL